MLPSRGLLNVYLHSLLSLQNAYIDSNSCSTLLFFFLNLNWWFVMFNMLQEYFQPHLEHLKHTPFITAKLSGSQRKNIF